jgi:hypothetical protein
MDNLFILLLLASLVLLVIGLINPKTSLFWYKKERTRKKSGLIYGGLTILFFILFGVSTDTKKASTSNDTAQTTATTEPSVPEVTQAQKDSIAKVEKEKELEEIKKNTISAKDLTATYEANEVNADNNLKGKTFYVTGTVSDIKKDIMDDIYVTLEGNEMFRQVQCYFDDKETAGKLQKGMKVTFKGKCDGLMMNVLMKDCVLVDNTQ